MTKVMGLWRALKEIIPEVSGVGALVKDMIIILSVPLSDLAVRLDGKPYFERLWLEGSLL